MTNTAPRSRSKATHRGHCQLCGALQKLPKNRLSKHGYTVAHGYFSGVCRGAAQLPFEQSYHLVLDEIERASDALTALQTRITTLRQVVGPETLMWMHTFVPGDHGRPSYRLWEPVALRASFVSTDDYLRVEYRYTEHHGRETGGYSSGFNGVSVRELPPGASCEALRQATVLKYNRIYAQWLEHEVSSLQRYIAWQRERIANWKEAPLVTLDGKLEDAAFKPTPAPY